MRRRLLIIAIFLLAGAVTNVAVAWGFWQWGERPAGGIAGDRAMRRAEVEPADVERWRRRASAGWPAEPRHAQTAEHLGLRFRDLFLRPASCVVLMVDGRRPVARPNYRVEMVACGWPLAALQIEHWYLFESGVWASRTSGWTVGRFELPIRGSWGWDVKRLELPRRPLWPGFASNTVFYATILWLLACGPFALRRFVRVRRGLCPACAYPMGESATCTECGKALPGVAGAK
jgi:hypothetical protein